MLLNLSRWQTKFQVLYLKETQNHLLECDALKDSNIVKEVPEYADIHGKHLQKMENISKILQDKFKLLKELHEQNCCTPAKME